MKELKIAIGGIPVIVWGEPSEKVYIYVHGKMSCKEYARNFAQRYSCDLTISQDSEHAFMQDNDKGIVEKWLEKNI